MTITNNLIPLGKYNRPGTKSSPKRICVHYTGDVGASAERLALFFTSNSNATTSSQYIVGYDGEIIRCIPDDEIAYAASNENADTIHIEVCYKDTSGVFTEKSIAALAELVQWLMQEYGISADKVLRHYDLTGKHCPIYYVDSARWQALHSRITSASAKLYRVQIGAFASKENAQNYLKKAKGSGFDGFIVEG